MNNLSLVPSIDELEPGLQEKLKELLSHSRARATLRQYESTWRKWVTWANKRGVQPFPAYPGDIVTYMMEASERGATKNTLKMFLTVQRLSHKGRIDDPVKHIAVQETWKAIRRKDRRPIKKARTIGLGELGLMVRAVLEQHPLRKYRDKTLLCVGWAGALRASELVELKWDDVKFCSQGVEITIRASKTDQEGKGAVVALPWYTNEYQEICPVRSLEFLNARTPTDHVFRAYRGGHWGNPISTKAVTRIIQRSAALAGLPGRYSAHSLRRGFATWAASEGAPDSQIMHHGRWKSREVMDGYVEIAHLWRTNVLKAILGSYDDPV